MSPWRSLRARFAAAMGVGGVAFGVILTAVMALHLESMTRDAAYRVLEGTAKKLAAKLADDLRER